jgi:hypothetical protein
VQVLDVIEKSAAQNSVDLAQATAGVALAELPRGLVTKLSTETVSEV